MEKIKRSRNREEGTAQYSRGNGDDRKLFTLRKGGQAIFKCLCLFVCCAAKPLYTAADAKLVWATSRSPWLSTCLHLEYNDAEVREKTLLFLEFKALKKTMLTSVTHLKRRKEKTVSFFQHAMQRLIIFQQNTLNCCFVFKGKYGGFLLLLRLFFCIIFSTVCKSP